MRHLTTTIDQLFAGGTGCLGDEGHRSGIFKTRQSGPLRVEKEGIVGDEQADRRVHGGPEKAVHQYACEHYGELARAFPQSQALLVPGSLGENISAGWLDERNVHIGDTFRVGSAIMQVSQPRSPCWKINHRFGEARMSVFVAQQRITGWYYRVIAAGEIRPGDAITLLERQTERFSIEQFWHVQLTHRPDGDDLAELIDVPGLAASWKQRLRERLAWLRKSASDVS
ncbi:MAG: MOSC domain-containing protein [Cupriavidus sp.]|nr:MAG: MOSC domain-containing protein [Cupriavidus sp.]